jgi:DNA-binding response OmpR family regulator
MKVLIAEDDPTSRLLLETVLRRWDYDVITTRDGVEAWQELQKADAPRLAILDWMMPNMDGVEVCQKARGTNSGRLIYLIILTAKGDKKDVVDGLEAGADDYLTKPFDRAELKARIRVGERVLRLQSNLADRVSELELALSRVKQLEELLPICSYCKKIRDSRNEWRTLEEYVRQHSEIQFSHGICPSCHKEFVAPQLEALRREQRRIK